MAAVNWQSVENYIDVKSPLVDSVAGTDWISFFDALGWMENSGRYGGYGGAGNSYIGMYQTNTTQLNYIHFFTTIGRDLLGVSSAAQYESNPIAQDFSAIMSFGGLPHSSASTAFVSRYTAVKRAAKSYHQDLYDGWNSIVGREITINYVGANDVVVGTHVVKFTEAAISVGAHLIGQGAMATAMAAVYNECFDQDGQLVSSVANLSSADYADDNGVAFTTFMLLMQDFDISPLIDAGNSLEEFEGFAGQLIAHRQEKIKKYLLDNDTEIILVPGDRYRATAAALVSSLGFSSEEIDNVKGVVVVTAGDANKNTEESDLIFTVDDEGALLRGGGGDDTIYGGLGEDVIYGGDGADTVKAGDKSDQIYGGDGENKLFGEDGSDLVVGGADADYLDGGKGADTLKGGGGRDIYIVDVEDTVEDDLLGMGAVILGNKLLTGGERKEDDPENEYKGGGNVYVLNGTTLVVNGGLTINKFKNGDLGINLKTKPEEEEEEEEEEEVPDTNEGETRTSPIVIDLDGDGIETKKVGSAYFDLNNDGLSERSGWVSPDEGLLVHDRNGDGRISNGAELFGNHSILNNGKTAGNGFQALAEYDNNGDGLINADDASYSSLQVWRDLNGNGISDAGELQSLADAGVVSISTGYTTSTQKDANGHEYRQIGSVTLANGTASVAADVWFKVDGARRINSGDIVLTPDIYFLANAKGFGNVHDLHQAMALDPALKGLLAQYVSATDAASRDALLDNLIYRWAG
ncbi:calcium-binding protein, partial [Metapseudomonas otitidis]|uniref:calcium-binding protein n=1 Tax=Metapseudomonas otitidis TaxID=319939 RepID=UPI0023F9D8B5